MGAIRFFRELVILLVLAFFAAGAVLLIDSTTDPGTKQPWDLLGGAVLCSLGAFAGYLLFRPSQHE